MTEIIGEIDAEFGNLIALWTEDFEDEDDISKNPVVHNIIADLEKKYSGTKLTVLQL